MFSFLSTVYAQSCNPTQEGVDLGNCLQLANGLPVSALYKEPAFLVNLIVRNVFVIGGVLIFLMIFYAGFKFIQDDKSAKEEARKIITTALVGGIIMFSAYWIVQIIGVLTGANVGLE